MSTISSNADINTKYQRVAAEYAKLKVQISTLKNAVIAEQVKNEKLSIDLHNSESTLRKLENEKEGFEFRNNQLVKRVESLQNEIDNIKQTSVKKRGLLFQKNTRAERSTELDNGVLQMELQKKVIENETLHKKISELENEYTETTSALNEQYRILEIENGKLKEELKKIKENIATDQTLNCNVEKQSKIQKAPENKSVVEVSAMGSQNLVLNSEESAARKETMQVLWLDALRMAKMLTAGFANLLQLFEQRSTIYPNDSNMEKLPEKTLLYGRRLLSSCDMFEACSSSIETILMKNADDSCCNLSAECTGITSIISNALFSCSEWQELFSENNVDENRVSWCGANLSKCNENWTISFLTLLRSLIALSQQIECKDDSNQSALSLFSLIEDLKISLADCNRAYAAKIFNENRIPTATKRLRCVNECINNCLTSLQRNLNNFAAFVQLIMNSSQLKDEEVVSENTEVVSSPILDSLLPNNDVKEIAHKNDGETKHEEEQISNSKCTRLGTDFWKSEMELATKRIVELEKQKERITLDYELLKTKLESMKSLESGIEVSEFPCKDADIICSYFEERIGDLHADIEYIRSRAFYYKHECKDLLKLAKLSEQENKTLREELNLVTVRESALKEELEMTRKSYELQLQNLHEHIANLNIQLVEQSKTVNSFKDILNGMTSTKQNSRKSLLK
ncbi:LOC129285 protein, putative [Brugia malayi]|uniref:Bm9385, isoform e n=1 Tax=Brugia malayi TaxID=6279 RepID=A0A1P6CGM4_BRUMA|nr:LOC129285 protein, putative [Brugia malayi]CDQ05592.1 Bm9385, isoform e [Brugia malayi]VIO97766.1 LOC129285 protein, putative [Brugia malayi]